MRYNNLPTFRVYFTGSRREIGGRKINREQVVFAEDDFAAEEKIKDMFQVGEILKVKKIQ